MASASGAKVMLCTDPYYHRGPRPDGGTWPEDDPVRVDTVNTLLRRTAERHPGVGHVQPEDGLDVLALFEPARQLPAQELGDARD